MKDADKREQRKSLLILSRAGAGSSPKGLTFNETLSATPLLVSLKQGDNSFDIFLSWHNPSVGKPTGLLRRLLCGAKVDFIQVRLHSTYAVCPLAQVIS